MIVQINLSVNLLNGNKNHNQKHIDRKIALTCVVYKSKTSGQGMVKRLNYLKFLLPIGFNGAAVEGFYRYELGRLLNQKSPISLFFVGKRCQINKCFSPFIASDFLILIYAQKYEVVLGSSR